MAAPIHAVLFHHGVRLAVGRLDGRDAHEQLAALDFSPAAQRQMIVALDIIAHVNSQLAPLDHDLKASRAFSPASGTAGATCTRGSALTTSPCAPSIPRPSS